MNHQILYKKDDLFLEEDEPVPEKFIHLKKSSSQNDIHIKPKINKRQKYRNKINKLFNQTNTNISNISRPKTTFNNINTSKFDNFNVQKQRYNFHKTYLYLHPDINNSFMERMEFDVYKRHIKEKEIDKLIEENKLKIEEEKRKRTFNRLIKDSKRRIEAMDNLEKMKNLLNKNNEITEEPLKKYTDEQWKKIYEERFKAYMERVKEKKEKKLKQELEQKLEKEKKEISLCKVKKASMEHIEKEANKMYYEAMKRNMKKKEKIIRLTNSKNSKYIFEDEEIYEFSNKKKYTKNNQDEIYNFHDDDNLNLFGKGNDISNDFLDKIPSNIQSIQESKNMDKYFDNTSSDINKEDNNKNMKKNDKIKSETNLKKIKYHFFEEEQKDYNNELNKKNNQKKDNKKKNKINNINYAKGSNKNIYKKEISYIIDQFFLRNKDKD